VEDVEELMDPLRALLYVLAFVFAVWLVVYLVGALA